MYTDTEGIVLRQTKTVNGRRMVLLFSKKYGKISAGTSISEKSRNKTALSLRPFTYGRYMIFRNRESYNINSAEVIKSFYKIGEDIEKYMYSSYALEFTEKLIAEEQQAQALFSLILDFFSAMEERKKKYSTLVLAYQVKALRIIGYMPIIDKCVRCGQKKQAAFFSIKEGGIICGDCINNEDTSKDTSNDTLIYQINFGIVDILKYFLENPLKNLENLALEEETLKQLKNIVKSYASYHLDLGELKSESFLTED